jgi:endonuclease/exonuclease/phosphatase (EEP) superfamily protein YafD
VSQTAVPTVRTAIKWIAIAAAWIAVLCGLAFTIPTVLGATLNHVHAALQLVRPWLGLVAAVPLLVAVVYRRPILVVVSGFCVIANVLPVWGAVTQVDAAERTDESVSIYVANVRFNNATPEAQADQALASGADVLVLIELTPRFAEIMQQKGVDSAYPHQALIPQVDPSGEGIYSRLPFVDQGDRWFGQAQSPVADVAFGDDALRVIAIHTYAPNQQWGLDRWWQSMDALAEYMRSDGLGPTVVAGDYNAVRWHPAMNDLLGTSFFDAHERVGKGLTSSWPAGGGLTGRIFGRVGPFARLDHALVYGAGVASVEDRPAAGSDHRAFVVTLVPAR